MKSSKMILIGTVVLGTGAVAATTLANKKLPVVDNSTHVTAENSTANSTVLTTAQPAQSDTPEFLTKQTVQGQEYTAQNAVKTVAEPAQPVGTPVKTNALTAPDPDAMPVVNGKIKTTAVTATDDATVANLADKKLVAEPTANTTPTNGGTAMATADCTPNKTAYSVGISHFKFPEANAADLVNVAGYKVHKDAAESLKKMMAAARADGAPLTLGSAFRSVSYQQGIINRKTRAGKSTKEIYRMSAPAGYSEHHTGFAVDFSPINSGFAKTAGYRWLLKNANSYGWYQTFTAEYSAKSGVSEESWHWKYKGSETAKQMLKNGDCL